MELHWDSLPTYWLSIDPSGEPFSENDGNLPHFDLSHGHF